jgi:Secretion system C-terminal sorting domain
MKALYTLLFLSVLSFGQLAAQSCQYTLQLADSFGDGWNGASLTLTVAGVSTSYTIAASNNAATFYADIADGDLVTLSYTPGSYEYEVSFSILDPDFIPVYTSTIPPTIGEDFFTFTGDCPTCPAVSPNSYIVSGLTNNAVTLAWASGGNPGTYIVEYGPTGFEPGFGLTVTSNTVATVLSGLNPGVTYDYYVYRDCGGGDVSNAAPGFSFTTTSDFVLEACGYQLWLLTDYVYGWNGGSLVYEDGVSPFPQYFYNWNGVQQQYSINLYQNFPVTFMYETGWDDTYNNSAILVNNATGDTTVLFSETPEDGEVFTAVGCPTCGTPTSVNADPQSFNANLNWDNNGGDGTYKIEYGTLGFTLGTGTVKTKAFNKVTCEMDGLTPLTYYDAYIWMECGTETGMVVGPISFKTLATIDVGIAGFSAPVSGCNLSSSTTVKVKIKNFGGSPQSLIDFRYSVNGVQQQVAPPIDGLFTGVVSNDSIIEFAFDFPYNFSPTGSYEIAAWTEFDNDVDASNDTFYTTLFSIPSFNAPYHEDFEEGVGSAGWLPYAGNNGSEAWEFGTPNKPLINGAYSGDDCYVTKLSGLYENDDVYNLESPCFDLSAATTTPTVHLAINYETPQGYDGAYLEASSDGGLTWSTVGDAFSTEGENWYNGTSYYDGSFPFWSGSSFGWVIASHPLTGYEGASNVRFRIVFYSNEFSWQQANGIAVDDIWITVPAPKDLAIIAVDRASTNDCGLTEDQIVVTIKNFGSSPQTGFDVGYINEMGNVFTENVGTAAIAGNGGTLDYTFAGNVNTLFKSVPVTAWTDLAGDAAAVNDTFNGNVIGAIPLPLSFKQDFEASTFNIPTGWITNLGTSYVFTSNYYLLPTQYAIGSNLYGTFSTMDIRTPAFGPINSGNMLTFDYRYTTYNSFGETVYTLIPGDKLEAQISIDCGDTWTTIWSVDDVTQNFAAAPAMNAASVDISTFAGQPIIVRFYATNGGGDYHLFVDNVNVLGCPANFSLSSAITNDINNNGVGVISVSGTTGNEGITYAWSNGATGASISGLSQGSYSVTATDSYGCTDMATYSVSNTVGTNENSLVRSAILMPNPTNDITVLDIELDQVRDLQIEVLDVVGRVVSTKSLNQVIATELTLDLTANAAGVYFVRISDGKESTTLRLLKQ